MRFHPRWALLAAILFVIEVCIALFARDGFVRPYLGDVLVVMLIFSAVLAVLRIRTMPLAISVLLFAIGVEITQGLGLITHLGWENNTVAKLVLGNTFQWGDLLCYSLGTIGSLGIARWMGKDER